MRCLSLDNGYVSTIGNWACRHIRKSKGKICSGAHPRGKIFVLIICLDDNSIYLRLYFMYFSIYVRVQLHIYEDFGTLVEKIDLSKMKTKEIHTMFKEKGFTQKPEYLAKLRGVER